MSNKEAIKSSLGPCLVLAGAGTGKTFTIVDKVKHLVENKIYPAKNIVCITFSNEAANNLTLRLTKVLKKEIPIIRTFHGFSADLLREHAEKLEIDSKFKILDPDQAKVILHRNLKVDPFNCHRYISTISTAKDLGIPIEEFRSYIESELNVYKDVNLEKRLENLNFELQTLHLSKVKKDKKELVKEIKNIKKLLDIKKFVNIWSAYEKLKNKGKYLDYSDLNLYSLKLLQNNPEIAKNYSYVIVDEFQDTNKLQLDFLFSLATEGNITVVGDINQSIYRFRGAYKENLNLFKKHFKLTSKEIFSLDKSFRSPNTVLRVAHKLISNNYYNKEECFYVSNANNIEGEKVNVFEIKDAKEEARKVIEIIKKREEEGLPLEEICVMFRAHQYGRIIKRSLDNAKVQYYSVTKSSLLKQKSVKTAVDYLTILNKLKKKEKGGEEAWWDILYQLNFNQSDMVLIGKTIRQFLRQKRDSEEKSNEIISLYFFNNLQNLGFSDEGKVASKILIEKIKLLLPFLDKPISEILTELYKVSGLLNNDKSQNQKEVFVNLMKFHEIAKVHEDLYDSDISNFLYYLGILETLEIDIDAPQLEEKGVRLMTSHATKGLEFDTVIITNMAQDRFPLSRYVSNSLIPTELLPELKEELSSVSKDQREEFITNYQKENQLQEERRLAYVSFTRTKENLFLTYANEYSSKKTFPSQFLNEINYKKNPDINFESDLEVKYVEVEDKIAPSIKSALNSSDFESAINSFSKESQNKEQKKLSPSALRLFIDCQKEFEYRYVFNMPERKKFSWESMQLGSFVHMVLEKGVKSNFHSIEEFLEYSKELSLDEEWASINLDEVETLIKVFFERHKGRYSSSSKTEQFLPLNIEGMEFIGYADRIDFTKEGAQIVDYKTGKTAISPKDRDWQLGFYALAAKEKYGKVNKIILDMLRQEKPIEFEIDDKGNAVCISSDRISGFNIYDVENELVETAKLIQNAYKIGFKPCTIEKNCEFCNEYVYNL